MKVLMQARPDLEQIPAGDTTQILKTKAALEELGVEVDLSLRFHSDLSDYQLVHCFNLIRIEDTYQQIKNAVTQNCPIVLTPIYWNMEEFLEKISGNNIRWWQNGMAKRNEALSLVDLILPNSKSEMCQLKADFNVEKPYQVVYNGVDSSFYEASSEEFEKEYGLKDFVLCVGRIIPRKNQLTVIKSLLNTDLRMVFIGDINDYQYYLQCKETGGEQVTFIPHLSQKNLRSAYAAAKTHVLASWFDTPGLVNLEAGLAGCNLVASNRGTAHEYFKDLVWYCSPEDFDSIQSSVLEAFHSPRIDDLSSHILRNFTWKHIGIATKNAYERLLSSQYISRVM